MPRMNGFEATRAIKEGLPETKDLIVKLNGGEQKATSLVASVDEQLERDHKGGAPTGDNQILGK
jgi:CheY-like chemotaxis protein